jgi:hypothetical protein
VLWGFLGEGSPTPLDVEGAGLIAQHDALGIGADADQGNGKSPVAGEIAALSDRADQGRAEAVEFTRGDDEDVSRPGLQRAAALRLRDGDGQGLRRPRRDRRAGAGRRDACALLAKTNHDS